MESTSETHLLPARVSKQDIPAMYTWIAPTHDWLAVLVEAKARSRGLEMAEIKEGEQILEVAVGTGLSFKHIIRQNGTGFNTGVDLTPAMLNKAKKRAARSGQRNYSLLAGDAYALQFPDNTFDLVMNSYMFDLLPVTDFVPVLSEFKRVLKPGGRLVQINMAPGKAWYNFLWEGLYRLHPALLGGCRGVEMERYYKEAGFDKIEREYISQRTFPSEVIRGFKPASTTT
ncbi:MAG: class I SAM-dependent methyltransferase [Rhodothermales bacterium]